MVKNFFQTLIKDRSQTGFRTIFVGVLLWSILFLFITILLLIRALNGNFVTVLPVWLFILINTTVTGIILFVRTLLYRCYCTLMCSDSYVPSYFSARDYLFFMWNVFLHILLIFWGGALLCGGFSAVNLIFYVFFLIIDAFYLGYLFFSVRENKIRLQTELLDKNIFLEHSIKNDDVLSKNFSEEENVPVSAAVLLKDASVSQNAAESEEPSFQSTDSEPSCHECTKNEFMEEVFLDQEYTEEEEVVLPPNVIQQLSRRVMENQDILEGFLRAEFTTEQKHISLHVAFCPPFDKTPKIECFPAEGDAQLNMARPSPHGVALYVKKVEEISCVVFYFKAWVEK
ncbi:MAG: hypothetical protein Q4C96_05550 [Planctomycetia bacterium]|nr:hypothetical protein [Planctomycetia bacterium]